MGNDSSLIVQGKGRVRMEVNDIIHVIIKCIFCTRTEDQSAQHRPTLRKWTCCAYSTREL